MSRRVVHSQEVSLRQYAHVQTVVRFRHLLPTTNCAVRLVTSREHFVERFPNEDFLVVENVIHI